MNYYRFFLKLTILLLFPLSLFFEIGHKAFSEEYSTPSSGVHKINVPTIPKQETFSASISSNWNLLSLPFKPENSSIEVVLSDIKDTIVSAWMWQNDSWAVYVPSFTFEEYTDYLNTKGFESFSSIEPGLGFWINAYTSKILTNPGIQPDDTSLNLHFGWNLIGLKSSLPESITELISGNENKITSIWRWKNNTWAVFLPQHGAVATIAYAKGKGFEVLAGINPGEGFWVNCKQPIILPGIKNETITNSLGMVFKLIPAGTFIMGSPDDEPGRYWNEIQHQVTLTKPYYIQTTEVTQAQWEAVMGSNPSYFSNCGPHCPVEQVSWNDVQDFIARLNQLEGVNLYRLPTEAEWEYAARAGSPTAFANGDISAMDCEYDPNLDAVGWYCGNSGVTYDGCYDSSKWGGQSCAGTHPVAKKQANAWGLYDMHGNAYEWVQDLYEIYPWDEVTDPMGPSSGSYRVKRGGFWNYVAEGCRLADRCTIEPDVGFFSMGLRLTRTP